MLVNVKIGIPSCPNNGCILLFLRLIIPLFLFLFNYNYYSRISMLVPLINCLNRHLQMLLYPRSLFVKYVDHDMVT